MSGIEPFVFVMLAAAAALGGLIYRTQRRRARLSEAWSEAARRVGLTEICLETRGFMHVQGRSGTREVRFQDRRSRNERERTWLVVQGAPGIRLRAEEWDTALEKAIGIRELQTGDEAFDHDVHVQGPPEVLRAALDAETRTLLRGLVRGWRVSMRERELVAPLPASLVEEPEQLAALLKDLLDLAGRLDRPEDMAARIADSTRREPEWRVRLGNLRLLVEKFPSHLATREALELGRSDEHPEVRLRAALDSGNEGLATLLEMASLRSSDDSCAARAILALGDQLSPEGAEEILGRALRERQIQTAMACLDRLGRAGSPAVVALLAKVLALEEGPVAVAAARALGASGAGAAEAPLLQALARGSDVGASAAAALGRVGSTGAVLPLKEAAAREDAPSHLQRAARQAIAEIQSRLQGASPGQVSLAEGESGQLSIADEDPSGRVSRAKPNPGGAR